MAHVDSDFPIANDFLFEPWHETLSAIGVCAQKSLVHKQEVGMILVPISVHYNCRKSICLSELHGLYSTYGRYYA